MTKSSDRKYRDDVDEVAKVIFESYEPMMADLAISFGEHFKKPADQALVLMRRIARKRCTEIAVKLLARSEPGQPVRTEVVLAAAKSLRKTFDER